MILSRRYAPGNFPHRSDIDHFGVMFPSWPSSYIGELPLNWDDGMSYPTLSAKMELSDTAFVSFGDACGQKSYAFRTQVKEEDMQFPIFAQGIRYTMNILPTYNMLIATKRCTILFFAMFPTICCSQVHRYQDNWR